MTLTVFDRGFMRMIYARSWCYMKEIREIFSDQMKLKKLYGTRRKKDNYAVREDCPSKLWRLFVSNCVKLGYIQPPSPPWWAPPPSPRTTGSPPPPSRLNPPAILVKPHSPPTSDPIFPCHRFLTLSWLLFSRLHFVATFWQESSCLEPKLNSPIRKLDFKTQSA